MFEHFMLELGRQYAGRVLLIAKTAMGLQAQLIIKHEVQNSNK